MTTHAEARDWTTPEFGAALDAIGLPQNRIAKLFGISCRHVRRWQRGDRRVPCGIAILVHLLVAKAITIDQVELAAGATPVRTNGAKPEPPTLLVKPALGQSALARAKSATLVDPGLTTAEKVCALVPEACRWPYGDPRRPDFHFCGNSVVEQPYCEYHHGVARMVPQTGSGRGVRVGHVTHECQPAPAHGSPSTPGPFSATGAFRPPISRAAFPGSAPPPA